MSALMSDALFAGFETHVERLKAARKRRQEALAFKGALETEASVAENEGVEPSEPASEPPTTGATSRSHPCKSTRFLRRASPPALAPCSASTAAT